MLGYEQNGYYLTERYKLSCRRLIENQHANHLSIQPQVLLIQTNVWVQKKICLVEYMFGGIL